MPQNKPFRFGPIALTTTLTTNLLNPGTTTGGVGSTAAPYNNLFILLKKIRVINKTGGAVTVSLWLGASGANAPGTEVFLNTGSVPANGFAESVDLLRMDVGDFLVGGAGAAASLTIYAEGEIGIA